MRKRMTATLALLATTALSGAALAADDVLTPVAKPDKLIVLAQADGGSSSGGGDSSGSSGDTNSSNNSGGDNTGDESGDTGNDADASGVDEETDGDGVDQAGTAADDASRGDADADAGESLEAEANATQQNPQGDRVGEGVQVEPGPNTPTDQGVGGQSTIETAAPDTETSPAAVPTSGAYRSYSEAPDAAGAVIAGGYSADDFVGRDIVNAEGEDLGEVVDLMIDDQGNASKVVADIGGFLGIGESRVAIDMSDITVEQGSGGLLVNMDQSELEALPAYELEDGIWAPDTD